jgi:hypothetical protein
MTTGRFVYATAVLGILGFSTTAGAQAWSAVTGDPSVFYPCGTSVDCEIAVSPVRALVATNCKLAMFNLSGMKLEERFVTGHSGVTIPSVWMTTSVISAAISTR